MKFFCFKWSNQLQVFVGNISKLLFTYTVCIKNGKISRNDILYDTCLISHSRRSSKKTSDQSERGTRSERWSSIWHPNDSPFSRRARRGERCVISAARCFTALTSLPEAWKIKRMHSNSPRHWGGGGGGGSNSIVLTGHDFQSGRHCGMLIYFLTGIVTFSQVVPCEPPEVGPPCAWCEVRHASVCSVLLLARYMYVSESQKIDCTVLPSMYLTQTDLPEWPNPIRHEPWSY
jgi:hypothetical protein